MEELAAEVKNFSALADTVVLPPWESYCKERVFPDKLIESNDDQTENQRYSKFNDYTFEKFPPRFSLTYSSMKNFKLFSASVAAVLHRYTGLETIPLVQRYDEGNGVYFQCATVTFKKNTTLPDVALQLYHDFLCFTSEQLQQLVKEGLLTQENLLSIFRFSVRDQFSPGIYIYDRSVEFELINEGIEIGIGVHFGPNFKLKQIQAIAAHVVTIMEIGSKFPDAILRKIPLLLPEDKTQRL